MWIILSFCVSSELRMYSGDENGSFLVMKGSMGDLQQRLFERVTLVVYKHILLLTTDVLLYDFLSVRVRRFLVPRVREKGNKSDHHVLASISPSASDTFTLYFTDFSEWSFLTSSCSTYRPRS